MLSVANFFVDKIDEVKLIGHIKSIDYLLYIQYLKRSRVLLLVSLIYGFDQQTIVSLWWLHFWIAKMARSGLVLLYRFLFTCLVVFSIAPQVLCDKEPHEESKEDDSVSTEVNHSFSIFIFDLIFFRLNMERSPSIWILLKALQMIWALSTLLSPPSLSSLYQSLETRPSSSQPLWPWDIPVLWYLLGPFWPSLSWPWYQVYFYQVHLRMIYLIIF